ncbi:hypothetical protein FGO68_gene3627 [Halteria grandinella]|uniref:Uncharacterized protein n=1 Tax=Halteria grandinella TaxID=5974 RepID=A0A8J8NNE5_HALGN|nr:hypothetical protein FGO68_gene3627 [Halteria grandinella]
MSEITTEVSTDQQSISATRDKLTGETKSTVSSSLNPSSSSATPSSQAQPQCKESIASSDQVAPKQEQASKDKYRVENPSQVALLAAPKHTSTVSKLTAWYYAVWNKKVGPISNRSPDKQINKNYLKLTSESGTIGDKVITATYMISTTLMLIVATSKYNHRINIKAIDHKINKQRMLNFENSLWQSQLEEQRHMNIRSQEAQRHSNNAQLEEQSHTNSMIRMRTQHQHELSMLSLRQSANIPLPDQRQVLSTSEETPSCKMPGITFVTLFEDSVGQDDTLEKRRVIADIVLAQFRMRIDQNVQNGGFEQCLQIYQKRKANDQILTSRRKLNDSIFISLRGHGDDAYLFRRSLQEEEYLLGWALEQETLIHNGLIQYEVKDASKVSMPVDFRGEVTEAAKKVCQDLGMLKDDDSYRPL